MDKYARLLLIFSPIFVVLFSIWQGAYNIDPHHWGLMLSNAKDLYEGQTPYQDIFIQYGILTTILQAFAFGIGKNMLSIIVITSICYAIGILLVYATALNVLKNKTTALYVFILLVLFHPLAMYPWSNYIAFPFLMYGVYVLATQSWQSPLTKITLLKLFFAGLAFGFAVLAREGLALAVVLLILLSFTYDLIQGREYKKTILCLLITALGFLLPIGIFFGYLASQSLLGYWVNLSIDLPAIYANTSFSYVKSFPFKALFKEIYTGYRHGDVRWILTSLILLSSLWVFILALLGKRKDYVTPGLAKIALASLLLVSSSLHLAETFRIATGSAVGIIALFAFLQSKEKLKPFFIFFALWLGLTATYGNRGNYFYPTWHTVMNAQTISMPEVLRGQRWSPEMTQYYQSIEGALTELQQKPCSIDYQINNTRNSLFKVISPIPQLQIAPFGAGVNIAALRADIDSGAAASQGARFVILDSVSQKDYAKVVPPKGFVLYLHLSIPEEEYFMPHKQELLIYVPKGCAK
jgi:hypothetical protein